MEEEFVAYEMSIRMKNIGFNDPCHAVYGYNMMDYSETGMDKRLVSLEEIRFTEGCFDMGKESITNSLLDGEVCSPTYRQCFKWFRDNYSLYVSMSIDEKRKFKFTITTLGQGIREDNSSGMRYDSYEECEFESLNRLISIVENLLRSHGGDI